jgi:hypothetical protein
VGDDVLELPAEGTKSERPFQSSDHCPERVGGMRFYVQRGRYGVDEPTERCELAFEGRDMKWRSLGLSGHARDER